MSKLNRRQFLGGLGALGLMPFVPVLNAHGAETSGPKRLVLIYTPHGTIRDRWLPTGTQNNFSFNEILQPLTALKHKVSIVDGLKIRAEESIGAPHTKGMPMLWTGSGLLEDNTFERKDQNGNHQFYYGWNEGASIDQIIAQHIHSVDPTPYRSLEFGLRCSNSHPGHRMIYAGSEQPLQPVESPYQALNTLFGAGTSVHQQAQIKAQRLSILDAVYPSVHSLKSKVGGEDAFKIDAHLDALRDIEYSLQNAVTCDAPDVPGGLHQGKVEDIPSLTSAQFKIMAQALACDMTRVCSFQFSRGENDQTTYPWLGVDHKVHHTITHDQFSEAIDDMTLIYRWYAEQVAAFLHELDSIPEGDGTVLDNTLVVWGSEISRGWDHRFDNMPFVLAGGGAGAIPMGQFYSFDGQEHNRLLVSMAHAMGLNSLNSFGTFDLGNGGLNW